uniref:Metallophos domain-containing protein n=1 Tax=Caenorhabditis tropicalis TaxID=1561998 RepID=A0A1I7UP77_9PELO
MVAQSKIFDAESHRFMKVFTVKMILARIRELLSELPYEGEVEGAKEFIKKPTVELWEMLIACLKNSLADEPFLVDVDLPVTLIGDIHGSVLHRLELTG